MDDHLVRTLNPEKTVRAVAAVTTKLCRHAAEIHGLVGPAAEALCRLLTASGLMATLTKAEERVTIEIQADGPLAMLVADADGDGNIRGYARWLRDMQRPDGSSDTTAMSVPGLVGRSGTVVVIRDLGLKELYQGVANLVSGEIDEDLEGYLNQSEQLPSFLRCRALLDEEGRIRAAAGLLLQSMPGGQEHLEKVRERLSPDFLVSFLKSEDPDKLSAIDLVNTLWETDLHVGEWRTLRFHCRCSKESAREALLTLPAQDIEELIQEGKADVTCHYCTRTWTFDPDELSAILEEVRAAEASSADDQQGN